MKWYNALVFAFGLAFCVTLALYPKTAPAQEVVSGRGILCDEAAQVVRVITADDFQATLVAVNGEKANACAVLEVAYIVHGETGETVRIHGSAWRLTQIIVVGAMTPQGWGTVTPLVQWTAFLVEERGA